MSMKAEQLEHRLAYSPAEAAKLTGIPERTVRELLARKVLRGRKAGRRWVVSRTALDAFLNEDDAPPPALLPFARK